MRFLFVSVQDGGIGLGEDAGAAVNLNFKSLKWIDENIRKKEKLKKKEYK